MKVSISDHHWSTALYVYTILIGQKFETRGSHIQHYTILNATNWRKKYYIFYAWFCMHTYWLEAKTPKWNPPDFPDSWCGTNFSRNTWLMNITNNRKEITSNKKSNVLFAAVTVYWLDKSLGASDAEVISRHSKQKLLLLQNYDQRRWSCCKIDETGASH